MKQPFTASEVRAVIAKNRDGVTDRKMEMLHAYADRLEADEKLMPVYQHRNKNGSLIKWFDCTAETYELMERNEHDRKHFDRRILYTHPSPPDADQKVTQECLAPPCIGKGVCAFEYRKVVTDAERLAEALRVTIAEIQGLREAMFRVYATAANGRDPTDAIEAMRSEMDKPWSVDNAREALAAHSAQAQPPVPKLNIRCETKDGRVVGSTYLDVVRVETEDDGSFTAVTNFWPQATQLPTAPQPAQDAKLPSDEDFRLHLGELTSAELRVAQAAFRFAMAKESGNE